VLKYAVLDGELGDLRIVAPLKKCQSEVGRGDSSCKLIIREFGVFNRSRSRRQHVLPDLHVLVASPLKP
jgi:hypothetical protein